MAVTVDTRNAGAKSGGATSISWSHTVSAGLTNGHLVVGAGTGSGAPHATVTGVNWDDGGANTAMSNTVNGTAAANDDHVVTDNIYTSLWVLVNPASGTKTIKVSVSKSCEITAGSESQDGVNQSSPYNAASPQLWANGANTNISQSVTSDTGELVIDYEAVNISAGPPTPVVGGSQTQIANQNNGANTSGGMMSDQVGANPNVTMAWTGLTANVNDTVGVGISLAAAAAGDTLFAQACL